MHRLRLGSRPKELCRLSEAFFIGLGGKSGVLPVRLRLSGKSLHQEIFSLGHN